MTVPADRSAHKHDGGDSGPRGYRFRRRQRVVGKTDFDRILRRGLRATNERLTMWVLPNGTDDTRLGLIVGRQHGRAVRRNRLKRLVREAFRLSQHELPGGFDLVCSPRAGVSLTLMGCRESLLRLAQRLARRWENGNAKGT